MHGFGIGLGLGRRVPVGGVDLDLLLGVALIEQLQSGETSADVESSGFDTDGRGVVAVRISDSGSEDVRVYASVDLEAWRHRHEHAPYPLPDWPSWSLGLGVGLTWSGP